MPFDSSKVFCSLGGMSRSSRRLFGDGDIVDAAGLCGGGGELGGVRPVVASALGDSGETGRLTRTGCVPPDPSMAGGVGVLPFAS